MLWYNNQNYSYYLPSHMQAEILLVVFKTIGEKTCRLNFRHTNRFMHTRRDEITQLKGSSSFFLTNFQTWDKNKVGPDFFHRRNLVTVFTLPLKVVLFLRLSSSSFVQNLNGTKLFCLSICGKKVFLVWIVRFDDWDSTFFIFFFVERKLY